MWIFANFKSTSNLSVFLLFMLLLLLLLFAFIFNKVALNTWFLFYNSCFFYCNSFLIQFYFQFYGQDFLNLWSNSSKWWFTFWREEESIHAVFVYRCCLMMVSLAMALAVAETNAARPFSYIMSFMLVLFIFFFLSKIVFPLKKRLIDTVVRRLGLQNILSGLTHFNAHWQWLLASWLNELWVCMYVGVHVCVFVCADKNMSVWFWGRFALYCY